MKKTVNDSSFGSSKKYGHLSVVDDEYYRSSSISKPYSEDMNVQYSHNNELNDVREDINSLKSYLQHINEVAAGAEKRGDEELEKIEGKVNDLQTKIAVLEERTKKLEHIPTKDELKSIVSEAIDSKEFPSKDYVESKVSKAVTKQVIWTAGIIITSVSIATGIIIRML